MPSPWSWLLPRRGEPDGGSAVLAELATGIPADLLSGLEPAGAAVPNRRDRIVDGGASVLEAGLATKILHDWLQNRHQTLFPLTVNIRTLNPAAGVVVARWMAVAVLANRPGPARDGSRASAWLASAGADAATLAAFQAALSDPPALDRIMAAITEHGLAAYAYVAALVTLDPGDPATAPLLDYLAIRLALPTAAIRSATRRYRR